MIKQEIFSAFGFAFIIGLGCLANYLTQLINVQILTEENEVSFFLLNELRILIFVLIRFSIQILLLHRGVIKT
jgi:hypothetical protein